MLKKNPSIIRGLFLSLDLFSKILNLIIITFILIFFLTPKFNKFFFFLKNFIKTLENSIPTEKILNIKNIIINIFLLLLILNLFSLFPHIFSIFSLINITLILSLRFWGSIILTNLFYFLKEFLIHLTPISTPIILISFIVIIELVRQFIRPITLLVRLGTNLTTGHLILGLISFFRIFSWIIQIPFFLLELIVALVQAYVFSLLVILYFNE